MRAKRSPDGSPPLAGRYPENQVEPYCFATAAPVRTAATTSRIA